MRKKLCKSGPYVRTLKYEHLEDRAMMAGNVAAACACGNLVICGDKCDNSICVRQICEGKWEVKGLCGTTINGCESFICCEPVCSIKIDLKEGCDTVKVSDGCLKGCLSICDNKGGNENICLTNLALGGLSVKTGNGCDDVRVSCVTVWCESKCQGKKDCNGACNGTCCIDTGCGNDCVVVHKVCGSCCKLDVKTGDGNDTCFITKCDVKQICADGGKGCDTVAVHSCRTDKIDIKGVDKKSRVCCDQNECRTIKCSTPPKASLADCVHEVTNCRDWSDWSCDQAELV